MVALESDPNAIVTAATRRLGVSASPQPSRQDLGRRFILWEHQTCGGRVPASRPARSGPMGDLHSPGSSARSAARPLSVSTRCPRPSRTTRPRTTNAVMVSPVTPARCQSVPLATQNRSIRSRTLSGVAPGSALFAMPAVSAVGYVRSTRLAEPQPLPKLLGNKSPDRMSRRSLTPDLLTP